MRLFDRLISPLLRIRETREPDFIIGGKEDPYLLRWFVIPRNAFVNVYLHEFRRSDDDRAHHDHGWLFNFTWMLLAGYLEHTIARGGIHVCTARSAGEWKFRWGRSPHRIELPARVFCVTLFITGPRIRNWGFHCPEEGWIPWERFTASDDSGSIGPGCSG